MNADETLRRVRALLERGDVARAEGLLARHWPRVEQRGAEAEPFQSVIRLAQKRSAQAGRFLAPGGGGAAAPAEAAHLLGLIRRAQRRTAEAVRFFRMAVRAKAEEPRYHFALGDALAALDDAHRAADCFGETLRLDPGFPDAQRAFARAALAAGRFAESEAAARALVREAPDAEAWDILSCALRAQGRLDEAIEAADAALGLDPGSAAARHAWAVAVGQRGRLEDALTAYETLTARGLHASTIAANHASVLLQLGRGEEAERLLADAVRRWSADTSVQVALAKARWQNGAGEAFTSTYEEAIARHPTAVLFRVQCAHLLRLAGFAQRAEALLRKGLASSPSHPAILAELGGVLAEAGRLGEAVILLERALTRAPASETTRASWLLVLLQLGRADEALAQVSPLRASAPFNQSWIALESLALRQLGDQRYHWLCDYNLMVRHYDLAPPRGFADATAFNQALAESLLKLHVGRDHPLDQSLRRGTQSARSLLAVADPVVCAYLKALGEPIRAYIAGMGEPDHPWSGRKCETFKVTGAWSVRLTPGGYHVNHIHPAGWISSTYYVALPASMAKRDANKGWLKLGEPPRPMPGCGVEKLIEPKVGRLVLFPAYMWHGTIPFDDGERLTAPFDVVPA